MSAWVVVDVVLAAAILLAAWRLLRGPGLPDRVVALDILSTTVVGFGCLRSIASGRFVFLDLALAIGLVGFIGTVAFALFIERSTDESLGEAEGEG